MYNDQHLQLFWYYKILINLATLFYISGYTHETQKPSKEVNTVSNLIILLSELDY